MQVQAKCFLDLSRNQVCDSHRSRSFELSEGATARDLAAKVGLDPEGIKLIFVNHREKTLDSNLKNGDEVAFSPY